MSEVEVQRWPRPVEHRDLSHRRYRVRYELAYDGGGSEWDGYYRTKLGARIAIHWNRTWASWGGSAILFDTQPPVGDSNA